MKRAIHIIFILALLPLTPAWAQLGSVGPNAPSQADLEARELLFGEILIDTYGTSGVIATLDRRFGIQPEDGITDLVITFEASEPLSESLFLRGFGFVKVRRSELQRGSSANWDVPSFLDGFRD